jgi:hypothetical protein
MTSTLPAGLQRRWTSHPRFGTYAKPKRHMVLEQAPTHRLIVFKHSRYDPGRKRLLPMPYVYHVARTWNRHSYFTSVYMSPVSLKESRYVSQVVLPNHVPEVAGRPRDHRDDRDRRSLGFAPAPRLDVWKIEVAMRAKVSSGRGEALPTERRLSRLLKRRASSGRA